MLVATSTPAKDSDRRSANSPDDVMASPEAGDVDVDIVGTPQADVDIVSTPQAALVSHTPPTDQARQEFVPIARAESSDTWADAALVSHTPPTDQARQEFVPIARAESSDTWADAETFFDAHDDGEDEGEEAEEEAQAATAFLSPTGLLSPPALSRIASAVASPHQPCSPHQGRLRRAFCAADVDKSGTLSKRQLYQALAGAGLVMTASEQLVIWRLFDRDADGKIAWEEFHRLGAALLLTCPPSTRKAALTPRGGFAHRAAADEQRLHRAATRIQGIARKKSVERLEQRLRLA